MKVKALSATAKVERLDGVGCRVWVGHDEDGNEVTLFVHRFSTDSLPANVPGDGLKPMPPPLAIADCRPAVPDDDAGQLSCARILEAQRVMEDRVDEAVKDIEVAKQFSMHCRAAVQSLDTDGSAMSSGHSIRQAFYLAGLFLDRELMRHIVRTKARSN